MAAMDQATCQIQYQCSFSEWHKNDSQKHDINMAHVAKTHPDAQEHVYSIGAGHIPDGGVGVLILDRSHLTGKGIWADKEGFCQGSAQWGLPGKFLEILASRVTFLCPPLMGQMKKLPRSYFFSDKAIDSLSECH